MEADQAEPSFSFSPPSDPVVVSATRDAPDCDDPTSTSFWMDTCSDLATGSTKVDLLSNPERNTYYNGSHIWSAIYDENCVTIKGSEMCYEEEVLYRLLSGLHSATTASIAKNYHPPSKRLNTTSYTPNPKFFMDRVVSNPDRIRNVHFTYAFLLRALSRSSPYLAGLPYSTGSPSDDARTTALMRRLLESSLLSDCAPAFTAFDEGVMFSNSAEGDDLKQSFKGVFRNVTSILDCVQCQQCKLHAKVSLLGYGTALKFLFLPEDMFAQSITENEIVAFINTLGKMSEAMVDIKELTEMYWEEQDELLKPVAAVSRAPDPDMCLGAVKAAARGGEVENELELAAMCLRGNPEIMALAAHYSSEPEKFAVLARVLDAPALPGLQSKVGADPDAVVVGGGLAGLAATLRILDRGGKVVLIEKEPRLGGNSAKASSGINACCPHNATYGDSVETFRDDTIRSAGDGARPDLVDVLVQGSEKAVKWLGDRVGVDLSRVAQLGGHSAKRTNRPANGMAGAEIIYGMQRAVKEYEKLGAVRIMLGSRVVELDTDEGGDGVEGTRVTGVSVLDGSTNLVVSISAPNIILATGGFASDRSPGSYLEKHRPELTRMPATAGEFSTGDGIALATRLGAGVVDMDKVQLHPTGWVDPADPKATTKTLAAELMRGVGGILLSPSGSRFCNEVSTRANVTDMMLRSDEEYVRTGVWNIEKDAPTYHMVLSEEAAEDGRKHVDLYQHKGLLSKVKGVEGLGEFMNISAANLRSTYAKYASSAAEGSDEFGKTVFRGLPSDVENGNFYVGVVVPVLHYCMGGLTIDASGNVLGEDGAVVSGLHAAGEVAGGVHGHNRLGGNSLLECTVFGTMVGDKIEIAERTATGTQTSSAPAPAKAKVGPITPSELQEHSIKDDCYVAIHGNVYDLTDFAEEHPPGAESIWKLCGQEATEVFKSVHSEGMLDDFVQDLVGVYTEG